MCRLLFFLSSRIPELVSRAIHMQQIREMPMECAESTKVRYSPASSIDLILTLSSDSLRWLQLPSPPIHVIKDSMRLLVPYDATSARRPSSLQLPAYFESVTRLEDIVKSDNISSNEAKEFQTMVSNSWETANTGLEKVSFLRSFWVFFSFHWIVGFRFADTTSGSLITISRSHRQSWKV